MSKLTEVDPYQQFLRDLFHSDDEDLSKLQSEAESEGIPGMSIGPEQGKFLQLLVQLTGARKVLEIGVLGGYSGTWIARALPEGGRADWPGVGTEARGLRPQAVAADGAGRQDRGTGRSCARFAPAPGEEAPFDLVFIDADKGNYPAYLDYALQYSRPGTVILGDNVEMWGSLVDPEKQDWDWVQGMRSFARVLSSHERLASTVVPYPDGLAMAVVK